jgi:hypothetical protein
VAWQPILKDAADAKSTDESQPALSEPELRALIGTAEANARTNQDYDVAQCDGD